jgi:hypothetical protein
MLRLLALLLLVPALCWADCTQAQLNTELTTDPATRNYASCAAGNDQCRLDLLNATCAGLPCRVNVGVIDSYLVNDAISDAERDTMTDLELQKFLSIVGPGRVNMGATNTQNALQRLFPAATRPLSRTALQNLANVQTSRAMVLCGRSANLLDISCGLRGDCR